MLKKNVSEKKVLNSGYLTTDFKKFDFLGNCHYFSSPNTGSTYHNIRIYFELNGIQYLLSKRLWVFSIFTHQTENNGM